MLTALQEFVLAGDEQAPQQQPATPPLSRNSRGPQLPEIDDPRFGIAAGARSRTIRRTWLDTFDWRLFRAGLTLELRADRGTAELILTGRDGQPVATETAPSGGSNGHIRWPSRIDALPPGPLREHLAPIAGVRALVPVTRATSMLTELRAVNEDEKTIAMLAMDQMSVTQPRPSSSPTPSPGPGPSPTPSLSPNPSQPPPGSPSSRCAAIRRRQPSSPTCSSDRRACPPRPTRRSRRRSPRPAAGQVTTQARSTSSSATRCLCRAGTDDGAAAAVRHLRGRTCTERSATSTPNSCMTSESRSAAPDRC